MWPGAYPMSKLAVNVKLKIQGVLQSALLAMQTCSVQKMRCGGTPGAIHTAGLFQAGISTGEVP